MTVKATHMGRAADLTVREWLASHAPRIGRLPFVLISSIDSERRVSSMGWVTALCGADPAWALSLSPLVISGASVVRLLADGNLFTGFDELWIPVGLPVEQPPDEAYLVAPRELDSESPPSIQAWIATSKCRLGVGDGCGMNYVMTDLELGRELGFA